MRLRRLGWTVLGLVGALLALMLGPGRDLLRAHFGGNPGLPANPMIAAWAKLWPAEGEPLPSDGRLVVEADAVYALSTEGLALAPEGGDPVPLEVAARFERGGVRQALLAPKAVLHPGQRYALVGPDLRPVHGTRLDSMLHRSWRAGPAAEPTPWSGPARLAGDNRCPWLRRLLRDCPERLPKRLFVETPSPARLFRVRVEGDATAEFLVSPAGHGELWLGLEGGALPLEEGKHYRLTLTAIDGAGREYPSPGPPLEVEGFSTG